MTFADSRRSHRQGGSRLCVGNIQGRPARQSNHERKWCLLSSVGLRRPGDRLWFCAKSRKVAAYAGRGRGGASGSPAAAVTPIRHGLNSGTTAALDFNSKLQGSERAQIDVSCFTDLVREASLRVAPARHVMTRENTMLLLGRSLRIAKANARWIPAGVSAQTSWVTGQALRVGSSFKLTLKMHETHAGRLLSGAVASGPAGGAANDRSAMRPRARPCRVSHPACRSRRHPVASSQVLGGEMQSAMETDVSPSGPAGSSPARTAWIAAFSRT